MALICTIYSPVHLSQIQGCIFTHVFQPLIPGSSGGQLFVSWRLKQADWYCWPPATCTNTGRNPDGTLWSRERLDGRMSFLPGSKPPPADSKISTNNMDTNNCQESIHKKGQIPSYCKTRKKKTKKERKEKKKTTLGKSERKSNLCTLSSAQAAVLLSL